MTRMLGSSELIRISLPVLSGKYIGDDIQEHNDTWTVDKHIDPGRTMGWSRS